MVHRQRLLGCVDFGQLIDIRGIMAQGMTQTRDVYRHFWVLAPLVLGLGSVTMLFGVLPKIMQDEYVYSSQARNSPFGEHQLSNYLFSWVMSSTKLCSGESFYGCAKAINVLLFLVGIFLVYLIAIRVLDLVWAVVVASITALSPLAIQTSFFMPETMYFMAMMFSVWIALVASEKGTYWLWGLLGVTLGLTSLVKPHGIFLLPALMAFTLLIEARRVGDAKKRKLMATLIVAAGFFASKAAVGFAFAGVNGLRLFGGYESPVDSTGRILRSETLNGQQTFLAGQPTTGFEAFLNVASTHLFMHAAAMLLLAGIPLLLSLRVLWRILSTRETIGVASSLMLLTSLLALSMLLLVPVFEGYVTSSGQDHSTRLILRYYEFLIPLFVIASFLVPRFVEPSRKSRFIQATLVASASLSFAGIFSSLFTGRYVDSTTLAGFEDARPILIAISIAIAISAFVWASNPAIGHFWISVGTIPLLLVTSMFVSQGLLVRTNSNEAYFGFAGKAANKALEFAPGENIVVVGENRPAVFTAKFWIDKSNIRDLLLVAGSTLSSDSELIAGVDYLVVFDEIKLSGDFELLQAGEGYRILAKGK